MGQVFVAVFKDSVDYKEFYLTTIWTPVIEIVSSFKLYEKEKNSSRPEEFVAKKKEQRLHFSKRNGHRAFTEESLGTQEGGGSGLWCGCQEIIIRLLTILQESVNTRRLKNTLL